MAVSDVFARVVAMVGGAAILMRREQGQPGEPALGRAPAIPPARPQRVPTLKMPTARGWPEGRTPVAAPGLRVNAFAAGLKHPRWLHVLPDGGGLAGMLRQRPGVLRQGLLQGRGPGLGRVVLAERRRDAGERAGRSRRRADVLREAGVLLHDEGGLLPLIFPPR